MSRMIATANAVTSAEQSSPRATIILATVLGLGLVFLSGIAQSETLHDAAHDLRHAAGYPCH
ncbi:CbtB domain-containing protein [Paracoccus cavernae]|uniref:CbtB domain-containing protein n=1 Tax=Paracoccus cavernae TaxID=1571207 RepID=A0ABT8D7S6_9RHOB|nr:CbtB domain-containing protein [Paracoccus cavernae]